MLTPICCMTCGLPCADKYEVFSHIRQERVQAALKKQNCAPKQGLTDPGLGVDMSDVFDALGVKFACCRKTLATAMQFNDYW